MNSRDKLRSLQILSRHHIGIPRTTFVRDKKDVLPAIERVGGAPVVIKLIRPSVVARIGSTVYDGSVKTQLERMRQQLVEK